MEKESIKYDFDREIDRHNTGAIKIEGACEMCGCSDVNPLWIADMDFAVCPEIIKALRHRLENPVLGYSQPSASYWNSITSWLGRRHGLEVKREDIAFLPGVVRGVAYAVLFFTRENDGIVIQPPVYHPFKIVIQGNNRRVVENPLIHHEDGSYSMDLEGLERIMREEHPKMLILCNPHNPAGIQWDEETLRRVASLAKQYGVRVVSDEIHSDLMLYGNRHVPFLSCGPDAEEMGIMLGAPSKTFNIPGMVSSWVVVKNCETRKAFFGWLEANEFSSPTMMATIAAEAAYLNGEEWLKQLIPYIEANVEATIDFCEREMPGVKALRPEASFLVWLDFTGIGFSQTELVDRLVHKGHILLNDGAMFGRQGEGHMRLNVALPRHLLLKALGQIKESIM